MISCSQETVINENISGEATTPDTKICVNIKTENSRTVRPEITKWEITVTNKSNSNSLTFSRTIDGKATSATFVNITAGEYEITVRGIHEDSNRKTIILTANPTFEVKPNTVNVCEIIPEDNFAYDTNGNPYNGNLSIQISGLKDLFTEGETLLLTCTKLPETNNESDTTCALIFNEEGKTSGGISEIPVGSYKIEITHNDEAKTKTKVNLVKDPVVNIYDNTTTDINWEWNYDSKEINTDQKLKGIKIPVWNKPVSNWNYPAESSAPAKNGYLSANALFAEPIWDDKSYNFEYTDEYTDEEGKTTTKYTSEIPASEFDFINCAYDDNRGLWVLSGTKSITSFYDENGNPYNDGQIFCYVLKNLSTGENYKFSCSDSLAQDFTVVTIEGKKYLFSISSSGNNQILYAELKKDETVEITNSFKDTGLSSNLGNITTLYINSTTIYIATTLRGNANIYTGTISTNDTTGTPTLELNKNGEGDAESLLSLDINSFINNDGNFSFYNSAFMISDMYINEDKSKLYVTAGCVNYNTKSWYYNDYSDGGIYHSFGGLFEYTFGDDGELVKDEDNNFKVISYGINNNYDVNNPNTPVDPDNENEADPNPFLANTTNPDGGSQAISLETHIIQATSDDSKYFAGPRYIIPSGNDLLIVDSGFYGLVDKTLGTNNPFSLYGKQNRIFTFNINKNNDKSEGLKFNSLTKVDDSISFDYDYLTSSLQN